MVSTDGVILCGVAASGIGAATNATFNGITFANTTISKTASLPVWPTYANVTMDTSWQPLQTITIVTTGKLL